MKNILIVTGRYLPGYKDGGPVRTIKNLTDTFGDKYHFTIMCADRDHDDEKPYEGISYDTLNRVGKADVLYVKNGVFTFSSIKKAAKENDLIYVCGPYNGYAIKSLILKRLHIIKIPFVLAPMGSFSKGALKIKSTKKRIYFTAVKLLGLFKNIYFSLTSEVEKSELKNALKIDNKCFIAEDIMRNPKPHVKHGEMLKNGRLNIVFISRICEKKNLLGAIEILSKVRGKVSFSIYGNIEDKDYYDRCTKKLEELPDNIKWGYMENADSEDVPNILSRYDVLLFPTYGENFGHVIGEALLSGTVPIISDTTPWLDLGVYEAGFVFSLNDISDFVSCIDRLYCDSKNELMEMSENAMKYYEMKYNKSMKKNGYTEMFDELLR